MNNRNTVDTFINTSPLALAWVFPFGAFGLIPFLNLPWVNVLLVLMGMAALNRWYLVRVQRPPLEYWWPIIIVVAASMVALRNGEYSTVSYLFQAILVFFIPLTLAANGTVACSAITVLGAASGVVALMQWGAEFAWIPPTVVFPPANLLLAGPTNLASGLLITLCGLLANVIVVTHPKFGTGHRWVAWSALGAISTWLLFLIPKTPDILPEIIHPQYFCNAPLPLALSLVAVWISSRVAARSLVMAKTQKQTSSAVIPVAIGAAAVIHLGFGVAPPLCAVFLLGLVAALDTPWTEHRPQALSHPIWVLPVACIALQLSGALDLATSDPRNQAASGERRFEMEEWGELSRMLSCLLSRQPAHPDYSLLQARTLLAQRRPEAATDTYCSTNRENTPSTPIQIRNHRSFLNDLRDLSSAQVPGQAHFFFERVLVHDDEVEQVRNLLEIRRGRTSSIASVTEDSATLRRSIAALLGSPAFSQQLKDMEADALSGILADAGVTLAKFPEGMLNDFGPLMVRMQFGPNIMRLTALELDSGTKKEFQQSIAESTFSAQKVGDLEWTPWLRNSNGGWEIELIGTDTLLTTLRHDSPLTAEFHTGTWPDTTEMVITTLYLP